jgi:hypothetical protein
MDHTILSVVHLPTSPMWSLGLIQATGPPSAPWIQPRHQFTPVLLELNQATGPPQCSLGFIQTTGTSQCSLGLIQATGPPQCSLRLIQATGLVGVVQLHCTYIQCSLHISTYTLAMQSMVSAFI